MSDIKIYALGGLDENGKNMYCIEVDYKIFVVDCGIKRPDVPQFGVDYIIPDFTYLIENKHRIAAVILTHFHDDIMDAIPYFIKKVNVPIYASKACCHYVKELMKENKITDYRLFELPRYGSITISSVNVTTFGLSHSTPDAIGVAIESEYGSIVVAQQYVIDFDMHEKAYSCDIGAIAEIGKKGVFAALIESYYADKNGFTAPKHRVSNQIKPVFEDAKGRIIVTIYGQNFYRVKEIIELCVEYRKKFFFYDDEYLKMMEKSRENGYLKYPDNLVLKKEDFVKNSNDAVIFVTGFGSRIFTGMHKIATGEDSLIELNENDTVIIASPVVSGTEKEASMMENELYRDNVQVFKLDSKEILSMHPSSEDIKMILYLLKPKYVLPIMGSYRNFLATAHLSLDAGYSADRIVILDNGQVASFSNGRLTSTSEIIENIGGDLINAKENNNVASSVLMDRTALSTDGAIIIGVAINFLTKEVIGGPDIQSRGVVYVKDSEYLIRSISKMVIDTINEKVADGSYSNKEARVEIKEKVTRYVLRETGKRPMIITAIIEINVGNK